MDFSIYEKEITKTGFPLEFNISEILRHEGWSIINNKYYIDDNQQTIREIDIVAYKVKRVKDFAVFTSLIISCKKNTSNLWALLTKQYDKKDKNLQLNPVHIWTNAPSLKFSISEENWQKKYYDYLAKENIKKAIGEPDFQTFAFQEMSIESGKPQNDKPIFDSITSLMKAQSYELESLSKRKNTRRNKQKYIYQFNLISIIDSELIRIHFEDKNIKASGLDQAIYISGYIIKKEPTFASINFVKASAFDSILKNYNLLHEANCSYFKQEDERFYLDAVSDYEKSKFLIQDFAQNIKFNLNYILQRERSNVEISDILKEMHLNWNEEDKILEIILVNLLEKEIKRLNSDQHLLAITQKSLKVIYHYDGRFQFLLSSF